MPTRPWLGIALSLVAACSFIDDFDRFHGAREEADAGEPDFDGGGDAPDAEQDAESDAGAESDAEPGADEDAGGDADVGEMDGAVPGAGDEACRGKPDGLSCGEGQLICRKGFCRTSRCGDGFVDSLRDEQCDDGNLVSADGCEPSSCRYSCEGNAQCDNGYPCDGVEVCDVASRRCMTHPDPATGLACRRGVVDGVCDGAGFCITPGCGDGTRGAGEACDPAESPAVPGCRADCTLGCVNDAACDDGDACNGSETCDVAHGTCKPGAKLACSDGDPCTHDDRCQPEAGCVFPLVDADGDHVSEETCAAGSRLLGGDCDGANAAVYPGATEYCDGLDNDCDGMRDEGAVMATCYPDADGDGYPAQQGAVMRCSCGAGTRLPRADGAWDCNDDPRRGGADVHPTQDAYFAVGYELPCAGGSGTCVSFDYNCDTAETGQYPAGTGSCGLLGLICSGGGYNGAAPPCGQVASYLVCEGGGLLSCGDRSEQRRQVCR